MFDGVPFIRLTRGLVAFVDPEDFDELSKINWHVSANVVGNHIYAIHQPRDCTKSKVAPLIRMHRFILNAPDALEVDHINGFTLDNRRANLRLCERINNSRNRKKPKAWRGRPCTSSFKGVHRSKTGKWIAQIHPDNKLVNLGSFDIEIEAARAYDTAAKQFFGPFARLNFPEQSASSVQSLFCTGDETQCRPTEPQNRPMETHP